MPFLLPFAPALIGAAGGIGAGLINRSATNAANKPTTTSSTTTPTEPPEFAELGALLRQQSIDRLNDPTGLPSGFIPQGIENINETSDANRQNLLNSLTARGLGASGPAAAGLTQLELGRGSEINQFQNLDAPMFANFLRQQDFSNAAGLFNARPLGQEGTGEISRPSGGSPIGTGLASGAELLAYLSGKGLFGGGSQQQKTQKTGGEIFNNLPSLGNFSFGF